MPYYDLGEIMKLDSIRVKDFKAIENAKIELGRVTILVGPNNCGKSSFLQATHWSARCAGNTALDDGSGTLSLSQSDYTPSKDYKQLSHFDTYGNQNGMPEAEVTFSGTLEDNEELDASIVIKSARNEGLTVKSSANNKIITNHIRKKDRFFSAYIPGLAGISEKEEFKSKRHVFAKAASGDSNIFLRNILLQIHKNSENQESELHTLCKWVSKVLEETRLKIEFNEEEDFHIKAEIQTEAMIEKASWKPLELAGTGVLQVIQIFAYMMLFRPKLLLIDEPDAHLHPSRQETLIKTLEEAAIEFDIQILISTHSFNVIRAATSPDTALVWMNNGSVKANDYLEKEGAETIRKIMGWGALEKELVFFVEDENFLLIKRLIDQWPDLSRKIAICPTYGVDNMPKADTLKGLRKGRGLTKPILIHRDRDYLTDQEIEVLYADVLQNNDVSIWVTRGNDVEWFFTDPRHIKAKFPDLNDELIKEYIDTAITQNAKKTDQNFTHHRKTWNTNHKLYKTGGSPQNSEVMSNLGGEGHPTSYGKGLLNILRDILNGKVDNPHLILEPSSDYQLAECLRQKIGELLNKD